MKTYAITLLLTTDAPEREAEAFAAELAEDARVHLRDGEELDLASVEPAPPERPPEGAQRPVPAAGVVRAGRRGRALRRARYAGSAREPQRSDQTARGFTVIVANQGRRRLPT